MNPAIQKPQLSECLSRTGWELFVDYWPWLIFVLIVCLAVLTFIRVTATSSDRVIEVLAKLGAAQPNSSPDNWLPVGRPTDSASLAEAKRIIHDEMRTRSAPAETRAEELFHLLGSERLELGYRNFYQTLYGSQHRFLQSLNAMPQGTVREDAQTYRTRFLDGLKEKPEKPHAFEEWLGFMFNAGAIEAKDNQLHLTQYGQDFLTWVLLKRLSNKTNEW